MQTSHAISDTIPSDVDTRPTQKSDVALVMSIARADKGAMRDLFCRYRLPVYRFALRLTRNPATAEDIVSDVFLEVWRHAGQFEARSRVSTWLLAIARNLAWSTMRQRPAEHLSAQVTERIEDIADTPEAATEKQQQRAILAHCLTRLSPVHREVIDLVYYHDKTVTEVAEIIGIPQPTVKTRMYYARLQIANLLRCTREANRVPSVLPRINAPGILPPTNAPGLPVGTGRLYG
jgi:RNA polymerase sigma-70 factor (ECF subfamily)